MKMYDMLLPVAMVALMIGAVIMWKSVNDEIEARAAQQRSCGCPCAPGVDLKEDDE